MKEDITQKIKDLWADIRQDPETLFEARQLLFIAIIAMGVCYGFYSLYVDSAQKKKSKYQSQIEELQSSDEDSESGPVSVEQVQKLIVRKNQLEEKIEVLQFQEKVMLEQYSGSAANESFTNTIFTLLPVSPVDIEQGFVKMSMMDSRSYDFLKINPVRLQGNIEFQEFVQYLEYIEDRSEVGMVGNIVLDIPGSESTAKKGAVQFNVILGQVVLKGK